MKNQPLTIYFAGGLFTLKDLLGNAALATAIEEASSGKLQCILPQALEQRETTPRSIRNNDLAQVMRCDLGLFHFDGTELDSGTVVEFMVAKFLDIPSVIVRSDFRASGDGGDPWNLMASFYPRTKNILVDSMAMYQNHLRKTGVTALMPEAAAYSTTACLSAGRDLAAQIVAAFNEVIAMPSTMQPTHREAVYEWIVRAVGGEFEKLISIQSARELSTVKTQKGLL